MCCNSSENISVWSSCIKLPVQRMLLGIVIDLGLTVFSGDITDAYAYSPAPNKTFLSINDSDWYILTTGKDINPCHVLPVFHCLQNHPESGKMWMHFRNNIIIN